MKKIVTLLMVFATLAALFAVPASARGYTLSIPSTVSSHNLEAYGLHTMNVYSTDVPPVIDGKVGVGEYPGPNNGCSLSSVPGDNLWMSSSNEAGAHQNGYQGRYDFTDYVLEEDKPEYINSYLTYDDKYLYFAVTTTIPAVRHTDATDDEIVSGGSKRRSKYWWIDTFINFMQTDNVSACNYNSVAQTRYNLYKYDYFNTAMTVTINETSGYRRVILPNEKKPSNFNRAYLSYWTDEETGVTWNTTTYKKAENFFYQVTVLDNGKWAVTFEGRYALGDVLRITDIENGDGTPLDRVPEWGSWGFNIRLQSSGNVKSTAPNGTEVEIFRDDVIYAQTMLPAYGAARTQANSKIGDYLFHNTVSAAVSSGHGLSVYYLANPVHYLGKYNPAVHGTDVDDKINVSPIGTTTTRVTRTRTPALTSGVRGVNYRVIGVATSSASATGDSLTTTFILAGVMLLFAAGAVSVILMKKRSTRL
ncbi:MAG: hypothetical protein E7580_03490 [Ruminococcaceae bacterium]|nr:hypothetical protein [Oscillospiraceae bacterium]